LKETTTYGNIPGLKKIGEWFNYVAFDIGGVEFASDPGGKKGRKEGAPDISMVFEDINDKADWYSFRCRNRRSWHERLRTVQCGD